MDSKWQSEVDDQKSTFAFGLFCVLYGVVYIGKPFNNRMSCRRVHCDDAKEKVTIRTKSHCVSIATPLTQLRIYDSICEQ